VKLGKKTLNRRLREQREKALYEQAMGRGVQSSGFSMRILDGPPESPPLPPNVIPIGVARRKRL